MRLISLLKIAAKRRFLAVSLDWRAGTSHYAEFEQTCHADDLVLERTDVLFFTRMSIAAPNEIWAISSAGLGIDTGFAHRSRSPT